MADNSECTIIGDAIYAPPPETEGFCDDSFLHREHNLTLRRVIAAGDHKHASSKQLKVLNTYLPTPVQARFYATDHEDETWESPCTSRLQSTKPIYRRLG